MSRLSCPFSLTFYAALRVFLSPSSMALITPSSSRPAQPSFVFLNVLSLSCSASLTARSQKHFADPLGELCVVLLRNSHGGATAPAHTHTQGFPDKYVMLACDLHYQQPTIVGVVPRAQLIRVRRRAPGHTVYVDEFRAGSCADERGVWQVQDAAGSLLETGLARRARAGPGLCPLSR